MRFFSKGGRSGIDKLADVEEEIREFVREQNDSDRDDKPPTNNLASLLERAAGAPEREIDKLIAELQALREKLHSEGSRVQQRVLDYATLSQAAMQSAKVTSEVLRNNRPAVESPYRTGNPV
jgi:hypothetical protein